MATNTTRYLRVNFEVEEVVAMWEKISQNLQEINRKKEALAAVNRQMKGDISLLQQETSLLADKSNAGYEMRNVECSLKSD